MSRSTSRRKQTGRAVLETGLHEVPWTWQALAMIVFSVFVVGVLQQSAIRRGPPTEAADPYRVDLNFASLEELDELPGIGRSLAGAIVQARPYSSVEEVVRVKGISPAMLVKLRSHLKATAGRRKVDRH
jgi:hypothetical protein